MDSAGNSKRPGPEAPPAVVVGLCAHGLTLVHALASRGVPVQALESNQRLPGFRTRHADVEAVDSIHGKGLVRTLVERVAPAPEGRRPVLFLTNDDMVRAIAGHWDEISDRYALSWAGCRAAIASLLSKGEHQARSEAAGCRFPPSRVLEDGSRLEEIARHPGYPAIAKPVRPLSSFKVQILESEQELVGLCRDHESALPFLVQKYVPGGDDHIFFSAMYLRGGEVLARFDGRKLRSWPLGHTTVAEPRPDDEIHGETRRFFAGLGLSGPVSLELKRDAEGHPWVIEPTVGRTDFWVGLCIANGVNLPWVEYCDQAGLPAPQTRQVDRRTWLNPERDPGGLLWYANALASRRVAGRRLAMPYLGQGDSPALFAAIGGTMRKRLTRTLKPKA